MKDITDLDHRTHAFRPDLAEASLRPFVKADRYVEPVMGHCICGVLPLFDKPTWDARQVSEIRYGEFLDIIENREDGYAWVQNKVDRYVGYIDNRGTLSQEIGDLSYRVAVMQSFIYEEPDPKARMRDRLTLGSYVRLMPYDGVFYELASGGFVAASHIAESQAVICADYTFTAGRFLKVPYLSGGRTSLGLDAAGLVQIALDMAGIEVPRDTDQQRAFLAHELPVHWRDVAWRRGDIVFFANHVGIMTDESHMICASQEEMCVTVGTLLHFVDLYGAVVSMAHPRVI